MLYGMTVAVAGARKPYRRCLASNRQDNKRAMTLASRLTQRHKVTAGFAAWRITSRYQRYYRA